MNIVLIGFRGTGKSSVAEALYKILRMQRVEMDAEICKLAGLRIPQIVESFGWEHFRELESQVAAKLAGKDRLIIDTGGGIVEREQNMEKLSQNALCCWLTASINTIIERIGDDPNRPRLYPNLTLEGEIAEILQRRSPLYERYANCQFSTDTFSSDEIAVSIGEHYHSHNQFENE